MKRIAWIVTLLLCLSVEANAQGLRKLGGADETDRVRIAEQAETERQEKWMLLVGVIAAAGIGYVVWKEYQKQQGWK